MQAGDTGRPLPWGKLEAYVLSQPQISDFNPPVGTPLWQPLLQVNRPTTDRSPLPHQAIAVFHSALKLYQAGLQPVPVPCIPGLQPKGQLLAILQVRVWFQAEKSQ